MRVTRETLDMALRLAGFPHNPEEVRELPNRYWPQNEAYERVRAENPWWAVRPTIEGVSSITQVEIRSRKRVIEIAWPVSYLRADMSIGGDTASEELVHAWSLGSLVDYLTALPTALRRAQTESEGRIQFSRIPSDGASESLCALPLRAERRVGETTDDVSFDILRLDGELVGSVFDSRMAARLTLAHNACRGLTTDQLATMNAFGSRVDAKHFSPAIACGEGSGNTD